MADKNLYANDLIHRFASHTFTETTVDSETKVEFKNASSVLIANKKNLNAIDAYRAIRLDLLGDERPIFLMTTTERDALSPIDNGTFICNITKGVNESYDGTAWNSAIGELGGVVHVSTGLVTTTDNTQTTVKSITLEEGKAYLLTAEIIGELADLSTVAGFTEHCTAKRVTGGSAVVVGSTSVHAGKDTGASSWSVAFTVSGNDFRVSVTGQNATTINWEADLNYLKF